MIIESFSTYLHAADPNVPATWILARWLWERLSIPPENMVDKVLHCEIGLVTSSTRGKSVVRLAAGREGPYYIFKPNSESGVRLLNSLYEFSLSYEHQKWARWLHTIKASDFNELQQ